jgi:uncharacterized protein
MRLEQIIDTLQLQPHPEGGYFSETYRSTQEIPGMDRQLMTCIYFLLTSENPSNFHRIKSDELWFYHAGSPLIVHTLDEQGHTETKIGSNLLRGEKPQFLVPRESIFGSSVSEENSYSLVSCVVAPGFDFADFELFSKKDLLRTYPTHLRIIERLTRF